MTIMDVRSINSAELVKAKARMKQAVRKNVYDILAKTCDDLLGDAVKAKEYLGFTGNTQTSYSCGLYLDGVLSYYVNQKMWSRRPVRKKVPKGVRVYLKTPYEGHPRSVTGTADVDSSFGDETSFRFLQSYKSIPKKGFSIVMTTGTEYSVYIEQTHNLNVLTDTFQRAKSLLSKNLKPIVQ